MKILCVDSPPATICSGTPSPSMSSTIIRVGAVIGSSSTSGVLLEAIPDGEIE